MKRIFDWAEVRAHVFNRTNYLVILFIGIFPPIFGVARYLSGLEDNHGAEHWGPFDGFLNLIYSYMVTTTMVFGMTGIIAMINQKLPWKGNVSKRIVIESLVIIAYSALVQSFLLWSLEGTRMIYIRRALTPQDYLTGVVFTTTITIIATAILEGNFLFQRWRESLVAVERLQKEQAMSQIATLRAQMDPHFLFNSLNVLSGLIKQDADRAEAFVDDFARVYRYLLEVKDEMVVPLKQEFQFAQQYLQLQQTRFQEGLEVQFNLDPQSLSLYLPPLSLQEAISNAIKHNIITPEEPLRIEISSLGDRLKINNNFQTRKEAIQGTGTGLSNVRDRYKLLEAPEPSFGLKGDSFEVELALLKLEE